MREKFLANQKYLPIAARYEFYKGISVVEAHRNFCEALGDDAMCFNDFEFWWFRFSKGNFDLDTQPPRTAEFSDIPDNITDKIIRKMDYAARCLFRKTSKKYRKAVDSIPFVIEKLKFESMRFSSRLEINGLKMQFCGMKREQRFYGNSNRLVFNSRKYLKWAVNELIFIFGLKNVTVKKLSVYVGNGVFNENLKLLKTMDSKFHVETFEMGFDWESPGKCNALINVEDEVMKVLPYLEPRVLENLEFNIYNEGLNLETYSIAKTWQWKYAKQLKIDGRANVKTESLTHFKKLSFMNDNSLLF
uniref:F-box domain-containing protein n=1 Tax=Caenorhabditis tropicalis TaxID=1561998 RepID=A0A1I7UPB4_9PELO